MSLALPKTLYMGEETETCRKRAVGMAQPYASALIRSMSHP